MDISHIQACNVWYIIYNYCDYALCIPSYSSAPPDYDEVMRSRDIHPYTIQQPSYTSQAHNK